jgi:hypothetical protein
MANSWSKEDKFHYESSEVWKELEKIVIDTVKRAGILQDKIAAAAETEAETKAQKELAKAYEATGKAAAASGIFAADDDEAEDDSEDNLEDEVVDDLRSLAQAAIAEGNIKLAYKIERTIDEILERVVTCE